MVLFDRLCLWCSHHLLVGDALHVADGLDVGRVGLLLRIQYGSFLASLDLVHYSHELYCLDFLVGGQRGQWIVGPAQCLDALVGQ